MGDLSRSKTIVSIKRQKSVIKSIFEKDIDIDPETGYTPQKDDLLALNTSGSKHNKFSTAVTTHEIEGVILDYDVESKVARICTRGEIQYKDLRLTVEDGKFRAVERTLRGLGLDLV